MTIPTQSTNVRVTGRRVVATLIDGIIFGIISTLLGSIFGTSDSASNLDIAGLSTGGSLTLLIIVVAYYVIMEGTTGRTVGKMVTGIKVIDERTGATPAFGPAVIRTVLRVVDGLFAYLVGFIIVLSSDRRRRLGDIAAKTQVVRA